MALFERPCGFLLAVRWQSMGVSRAECSTKATCPPVTPLFGHKKSNSLNPCIAICPYIRLPIYLHIPLHKSKTLKTAQRSKRLNYWQMWTTHWRQTEEELFESNQGDIRGVSDYFLFFEFFQKKVSLRHCSTLFFSGRGSPRAYAFTSSLGTESDT